MNVQCVYMSERRPVLEVWEANEAAHREFAAARDRLLADYPGDGRAVQVESTRRGCRVVGLTGSRPDGPWRAVGGGVWVPDKRPAAGRRLNERLTGIGYLVRWMPGMPVARVSGGRWFEPGVWRPDGADHVWVWWGCDAEVVEDNERGGFGAGQFDWAYWNRGRMSQFWSDREAMEEQAS